MFHRICYAEILRSVGEEVVVWDRETAALVKVSQLELSLGWGSDSIRGGSDIEMV